MSTRACGQKLLPILLAAVLGWSCAMAAEVYTLQIEPLPLEQSLQKFASQSGVQLVFFSHLTSGLNAPALRGQYSLSDALDTLLARSNLSYRVVNPGTVQILQRSAAGEVSASAPDVAGGSRAASRGAIALDLEEVTVSATASGLTATRVETPLREIPQTFSILSAEQMRQQNVTTPQEALAKSAGIVAIRESSLDQRFAARGFSVSMLHIDGSSALFSQSISTIPFLGGPDVVEFERVEVMRGADALFGADSQPGATVNLIRKRPRDTFSASMSGWVGSWNDYRLEADVTGPLVSSGRVRGRLVGVYYDRDYFYDIANLQRRKVFGALEVDVTQTTLLTVGGSYQWDKARPFLTGWPMYTDGSDAHLPRNLALAFDWAHYNVESREIYMNLEQAFGPDWKLRFGATSLQGILQFNYARLFSAIDPVTGGLLDQPDALRSAEPNTQRQLALDVTLTGALSLFGRRAEVAVGADLSRFHVKQADRILGTFGPVLDNVRDFDPADFPDPLALQDLNVAILQRQRTHLSGVFAALRVHATDSLSAVGGVRLSNGHYVIGATLYIDGEPGGSVGGNSRDKDKFTPYAGVVYEVSPVYSLYASYTDIYQTVAYTETIEGVTLRPVDGVVWEGGIKSAWRQGALNGALAVYRIRQSGLPERDARPRPPGRNSRCCFLPSGETLSKGVDTELSGKLTSNWLIGASYSYNVSRSDVDRGALSGQTPRHLVKVWTSTRLPGTLSRWEVGGTLHAQSRTAVSGDDSIFGPYTVRQPSYLALDLRASFDIDPNWRAALTVGNVFDKRYYETTSSSYAGNWYGEPRNVLFRVDGRF